MPEIELQFHKTTVIGTLTQKDKPSDYSNS